MAQNIRLKRSAVAAKVPLTTDLALGELAINTTDGKMYFKKDVSGTTSIIQLANDNEVVKLTGDQTVAGVKTFSSDLILPNSIRIGAGPGGTDNLIIGSGAGAALASGSISNFYAGTNAGSANTTGDYNIGIGASSLLSNTAGSNSVALGRQSSEKLPSNNGNTVSIGSFSLQHSLIGGGLGIGANSLRYNTLGVNNTALGLNALRDLNSAAASLTNTTPGTGGGAGPYTDVQLEYDSGTGEMRVYPVVTLTMSGGAVSTITITAAGSGATVTNGIVMKANAAAVALGVPSDWRCTLASVYTGGSNTAIGLNAMISATTCFGSTCIGAGALAATTFGGENTAIGYLALQLCSTGFYNSAVGVGCLANITNGYNNVGFGHGALQGSNGFYNSSFGSNAGRYIGTGSTQSTLQNNSIFIGFDSRAANNNETNQIVIGYQGRGDGSNTTVIGNSSTISTRLEGSLRRNAPVTKTADFTLGDRENWIINNKSGSSCTVTLPAASSWTGREVTFKTIQSQTLVSASSNVVPINTATAGTAILPATAGSWATLVSDGTNWVIMMKG